MADTKEKASDHASGLIYLLQCLGFTINLDKTILQPSQCLEFLGFMVNTIKMELSLQTQKMKKIRAESQQLLGVEHVTCHALLRLIGKMNATNQVIPPAPLFYRSHTDRPGVNPQGGEPGLRGNPCTVSRQQGGTSLVGHTDDTLEWQNAIVNGTRSDHRIRRLDPRLGCLSSRLQHRGTLVPPGEGVPYKLSGTASGDSSSTDICQKQDRY